AKFSPDDPDYDPFITDKLLSDESMQYVLNLALNALKRLLKNKKFTKSKAVEREMEQYLEENNPIISFVNNNQIEFDRRDIKVVYEEYRIYCNENGYQPVSNVNFGKQVRKLYGYKSKPFTINGETKRLYIKENE